ncbi:MAG: DUF6599 family protein [Candidatus Korobacteraceae bacterium]|jgi:hypothetical protein
MLCCLLKRFLVAAVSSLVLGSLAFASGGNDFLPQSFAGWTKSGPVQLNTDPANADAAYPAVLKEYGFADAETATYTRADGRKLTVKAARFNDASGAYGAFTFYRQPSMGTERIGTKAASANQRILFFRDNVLVEADFDRLTEMSAAELRELAGMLPAAKASAENLPSLPGYLPKGHAVENSAKYILGPQALAAQKGPLTPELVDFSHDPEILIQDYSSASGPLTLMLIQYPTPQIAGERLRALQSAEQSSPNSLLVRRSGPLVDVVTGAVGSSEAHALLNSVNYEAEVTWNEATSMSKRDNIGNLILGVFALTGSILLISLIFGIFFGGIRILMKRLFPDRIFDRPEDVDIIQLHLR